MDDGARVKALVPGPGSYETPDLKDIALPEGGRLSRKPPQQDKIILDEYPKPPPGTYGIPNDPTIPRQLYGVFGKDPRVSSFIEDQVKRSKGIPAPGAHDVMDSMENVRPFCPEGGRYLDQPGRIHGYFEEATKLAKDNPDPGRYNLPGAIRPNKGHGKLVWKYQSETLAASKKVIERVCGRGDENPAPGHYDLQATKPSKEAQSPALKGKESRPMPHPFHYNCTPDYANKFALGTPVRGQNSGDQIFGRDFKKDAMTPERRADKAKAIADEVSASNLPQTMAEREIEQPGDTVQWRSGGFALHGKSKSSPVLVKKKEHPAMEEMMSHFPALAKVNGRHDKTFVPMACKRPEIVKTHSKCPEYQCLQRKKWEMNAINEGIISSTVAALEPLDEEGLRERATEGLIDKAKFRMRMEGLSKEQQELVLAELPGVLHESTNSEENSPQASVRGQMATGESFGRGGHGHGAVVMTTGESFGKPGGGVMMADPFGDAPMRDTGGFDS